MTGNFVAKKMALVFLVLPADVIFSLFAFLSKDPG